MDAKNQATSGRRSSGSTGGAGSSCTASARGAGRRSAASSSKAFITATNQGKTPMPTPSSKAPNSVTETMKPTEPHMRTRPYRAASKPPPLPLPLCSAWFSVASYKGTTPLLARNSSPVTAATGTAARTPSKPRADSNAPAAARRISSTRRPLWSPHQLQA